LLRRGQSSKEIAQIEGISPDTVDTHRRHIRRKLNIASEQVNLVTFLQSLDGLEK
jgi:DNA-binding CsgD family transcriptional regulator